MVFSGHGPQGEFPGSGLKNPTEHCSHVGAGQGSSSHSRLSASYPAGHSTGKKHENTFSDVVLQFLL